MGRKFTTTEPKACLFNETSPNIQALVLRAAKRREAFVWKQIRSRVLAESSMRRSDIRLLRTKMRGWYEVAAIQIFNDRPEKPGDWETWTRYLDRVRKAEVNI